MSGVGSAGTTGWSADASTRAIRTLNGSRRALFDESNRLIKFALGALNPLLAFVPFIETGGGKDSDCHQLLRQVKAEGVKETKAPAK